MKADDLMDKLIEKALEEVTSRHAEEPDEEQREVATQIAIGALRYFMLKFTRNSVIAFDLQEALSFEGETGPYVQYAAVRARNILRKLEERGESAAGFRGGAERRCHGAAACGGGLLADAAGGLEGGFGGGARGASGEPAHMARYAFQLAQAFSNFYHEYPVLHEEDREKKMFLLWMTDFFRRSWSGRPGYLGIKIPAYM